VDVVVTGIGLLCCLGDLSRSWQRLQLGESGIRMHQPFPELPPYPLALIGATPSQITPLSQQLVAATLADANLKPPLADCGVALGSSRGCQAVWEEFASQREPDLKSWLETLPHQGAIAAARYLGSTGPVLAPMAACATGIWAIAQGYELIRRGECQQVLAGAVEAPITPLTLAGFEQMGALAKTGCYPFDCHRQGLVLGEGGALFLLEGAESALRRQAAIYGQILGVGLTCDAHHISTPEATGKGGILAIKHCLARSQSSTSAIDYIHAHGTSTQLNDCREAQILQFLFPQGVPVSSTKGATGHTLGASGALGVAFCLLALRWQQLPPCVGLKEPEFDLDFVRVPRRRKVKQVLCLSFGFGGQNGAIALGA
jgi:3-oxoacyl-[acyl-carrier-protein] synthase II